MTDLKAFKYLFIAVTALLSITILPITVYADSGTYTYDTSENGIVISGFQGDFSSLTIPREMDGQVVIGIENGAFSSADTLTDLTIPDGVVYIGENAFSNCPNLVSVRFLGDAPVTGVGAFRNCSPDLKIYYDPAKMGFGSPWNGFTAAAYPTEIPVTGIALDKTTAVLGIGENISIVPAVQPFEATDKAVSFISSDPSVASVDAAGSVSALSAGSTVITAITKDGGFTAACIVTVYQPPAVPVNELAVPRNYDEVRITWDLVTDAEGYEIYRSNTADGSYTKTATVNTNEFNNTGLKTGTVFYYKVRAFRTVSDIIVYSDYTPVIAVKTLTKSIGSTLFLYMSDLNHRNSVLARAIQLHYGDPHNTCALTVSESLRRVGMSIPLQTVRTNQVESQLIARGYKRVMDLKRLQPGDICFTTDVYGNLLGGHSTHTFTFMGWANKEKTLMNIVDNQTYTYGSVLHTRTILRSSITDATAFFYHTDTTDVLSILMLSSGITLSSADYNKVKISWKAADGAYGYYIYRAVSKDGIYVKVAATRNTVYTDTSLTAGKTYYYKVRAYSLAENLQVYGSYSGIYSVTPSLPAPTGLTGSTVSGKIKLSFQGVSSASGYQIYRSTAKNGTYTRIASTKYTSFTNSGLTRGRYYYYKVRAYRYVGKVTVYSKYLYINLPVKYIRDKNPLE